MEAYKNKWRTIFFHVMVWVVLFSFPYILSYDTDQAFKHVLAFSWIPLFLYMVVFYLNYLYLADKLFFSNQKVVFIISNVVLVILMIGIREGLTEYFFPRPEREGGSGPPRTMVYYVQTLSFLVPIVWAVALRTMERLIRSEVEKKEAANQQLKSDLQHLQYQLQPHFFFNSLNNIYALVDISPEKAKSTIHSLSKLMRYLLYDTRTELVPLAMEIEFLVKYIELSKLRLTDKTTVEYHFPKPDASVKVPPLLFISLIENAFKHGVSAQEESKIMFEITFDDAKIVFKGENTDFPKTHTDESGSGIGLRNLKDRLELLYPNKHYFHTEVESGHFHVTVEIPL
ncbi:sensor histidine kinase [Flagellimonas zhangzhouensis]|uniref:Histidine kinase n=1 Tax=Flagellimonas zhangzhouensis TaxID=1073328 RepID=A0A1H2YAB7_9FLAO|nr:histidine kinase [Allomuricauda zhangzhouensis]SDQ98057.1 Histidine kinase [Allomuricauda zhangzhouensis]SDX01778.1 Histidine kinase [Allomuricauda zhangzhouensis]